MPTTTIADAARGRGLARVRATFGRFLSGLDARGSGERLHAMSDHMLRDIGLHRGQIDDAVRGRLDAASRG